VVPVLGVLILAAVLSGGSVAGPGLPAPDFRLEDQQGHDFTLSMQRGHILVLLAGDRAGSEENRAWGFLLGKRYGSAITIIGIADTRGVPFFLKDRVRNSFRKERVRMLMDWDGSVFDGYGFTAGHANIVVIDRSGVIRYRYAGGRDPRVEERLGQQLADMLSRNQPSSTAAE
jgi:peroxiredoxin